MCEVYLHECDEQEEGVGSPPDLLIQESGQKGEDTILCGTTEEEHKERKYLTLCLHSKDEEEPNSALAKCINGVLMIFSQTHYNSIILKAT